MKYAKRACKFLYKGEIVAIQGPYYDDPKRTRTVSVFRQDLEALNSGKHKYIQDAFPYLSPDDREFLISGMSPEGWDATFPDE